MRCRWSRRRRRGNSRGRSCRRPVATPPGRRDRATGATAVPRRVREIAVKVRQREKRDHPEAGGGTAGGRTVTVARDGRLVQVPVLRIAPAQLSQQKVTTDLDIALDEKRDDAARIAALKAVGTACQGAGGPGMFRDGYDWDANFVSETKFQKLAKDSLAGTRSRA